MTESRWRIQPLAAEHTYRLAECHIACWREAYADLVPAHVLAAFDVRRRAAQWERDRLRYPGRTHVAVLGGAVIGFASTGESTDDNPVTPLELTALYVRSAWYGTGLADELVHTVLDPRTPYSLWVFEDNPRARAFYRRHGFRPDGARKIEPFTAVLELRMVRRARENEPGTRPSGPDIATG
ncbi:GNAT family N-acetyltransferase [Nocardia brasiliensis]|uniref:GNAT family N-acetyltransferase n=1 Tax=Nocardia brasiliensis TaxID=37326 RepID=A0A6G9XWP6_NOCBR|nr:GNAT family N-acetyltransferase [Nocardia brasiliensis]QIS05287.1 GNAT family N-acetyltransferase [Nocardia brasiliensis]